jgi:hypothetical protein
LIEAAHDVGQGCLAVVAGIEIDGKRHRPADSG